jgi:RNA polymerase sigma-70 factor (ECF subfamily)
MENLNMALAWTAAMALESMAPTEAPDMEEAALIAACRRGDQAGFAELVRRHQRRVSRLAGRFFRRREEVEEVAQETFLAAWRKLDTYREKAPFEHWLTRVCLNCCYAQVRRRRPAETPMPAEIEAPPANPDARLEVERLLKHLPATDRFMLLLMHGEGWSVEEIAGRLGWTRMNVKVRAHRARRKLRRLLEKGVEP